MSPSLLSTSPPSPLFPFLLSLPLLHCLLLNLPLPFSSFSLSFPLLSFLPLFPSALLLLSLYVSNSLPVSFIFWEKGLLHSKADLKHWRYAAKIHFELIILLPSEIPIAGDSAVHNCSCLKFVFRLFFFQLLDWEAVSFLKVAMWPLLL